MRLTSHAWCHYTTHRTKFTLILNGEMTSQRIMLRFACLVSTVKTHFYDKLEWPIHTKRPLPGIDEGSSQNASHVTRKLQTTAKILAGSFRFDPVASVGVKTMIKLAELKSLFSESTQYRSGLISMRRMQSVWSTLLEQNMDSFVMEWGRW